VKGRDRDEYDEKKGEFPAKCAFKSHSVFRYFFSVSLVFENLAPMHHLNQ